MCGIAGVWLRNQDTPTESVITTMRLTMRHRGPDDCGSHREPGVGLGHQRLSIFDLSIDGHQPMTNEDQTLWLVFNGAIYNFKELRQELVAAGHVFRSRTDSEVILHAYEQFGDRFVERLDGMFSFALWDRPRRRLVAARDRMGIKPFYYWWDGSMFVFASEIKAILRHPGVSITPNLDAIQQYLLFSHDYDDSTWFAGVRKLPPATCLVLSEDGLELSPYWDLRFEADHSTSEAEFSGQLRETVLAAMHQHLRSDVPIGCHLSGGIDSSSIVAMAAREQGPGLHTFSSAFTDAPQFDERRYIDIVASQFGTRHHVVLPAANDLPRLLPRLIWLLDEPVIGPAVLPMYRINEMVSTTEVKVVCGGQGADELFGGYPYFYLHAARNVTRALAARTANRPPLGEILRVPQYYWQGNAARWLVGRWSHGARIEWLRGQGTYREALARRYRELTSGLDALPAFERATHLAVKHYLPGLLHQEDRMSMAWAIESRVPLLDHRIVELAARMPSWVKVRRGVSKSILRSAMRGITPDTILDRRDKMGFPVPIGPWFRRELSEWVAGVLLSDRLAAAELIDPAGVREVFQLHASGTADQSQTIWKMLNLELWYRGVRDGWREQVHAC